MEGGAHAGEGARQKEEDLEVYCDGHLCVDGRPLPAVIEWDKLIRGTHSLLEVLVVFHPIQGKGETRVVEIIDISRIGASVL